MNSNAFQPAIRTARDKLPKITETEMGQKVDTARVRERRKLRFANIDELEHEIERIAEAERTGRLRQLGNWTAGQTCGHLATWINFWYEGFPFKVPWLIRLLIRPRIPGYIRDGLPAGVYIPKVAGGTYGTEPYDLNEGLALINAALERFRNEPVRYQSPGFGELTDEQRLQLTLRHAELHLGFLIPE
jgi:hypothetical protein